MFNVGPTQNNAINTTKAKNILILLKFLIPLSIPDQADHVNNTVAITIITTCVPKLEGILNTLNERERKVLALRFGLVDGTPRTLEEVGKDFDVTRERIRQIEAKALRKLKHPSRSQKLKDFLE